MKINISLLKMVIRLIILLILFVCLFLISAFLYSARYWPDIYNYVNANITITRIPTLSELNLTIIEVDYATEMYSTTDIDYDSSTRFDTTEDDAFSFDEFDFPKSKVRRNAKLEDMGKDYSEVPKKTILVDYFFVDEDSSSKIIKDLVDESKLTTRSQDVEVMSDVPSLVAVQKLNIQTSTTEDEILKGMAPWIATIFLKNETGSQFDYYCDGALVSDRAVLTAARCVSNATGSYSPESFIVILGKTSLRISGSQEKILRVQDVKTHVNFKIASSVAQNDLAVLTLEEPVLFNEGISKANLENIEINEEDGESSVSVTTAWGLSGDIALIYFDKEKSKACDSNNKVENTFCATYGDDVALCPSYGGLYVTKQANKLYLAGIRTGDPTDRGICFIKSVNYTSLTNNTQWVSENIDV
ncbi:proclotting enzyme-like isoform X2 [Ostrinia nubilalis]|uniref:proclotting enzyme-like isoform X2 n=1 Tax=Ostrinia nubilalis TaxID=29057 RepID=UPI00308267CD